MKIQVLVGKWRIGSIPMVKKQIQNIVQKIEENALGVKKCMYKENYSYRFLWSGKAV